MHCLAPPVSPLLTFEKIGWQWPLDLFEHTSQIKEKMEIPKNFKKHKIQVSESSNTEVFNQEWKKNEMRKSSQFKLENLKE